MSQASVIVHAEPKVLAQSVAARLIVKLTDAQASRGSAAAVRDSPARDAVDWSRVDLWWGDERFVASDDPERNERQAREALLDALPLNPARIHPMAPSDGPDGDDPEAAAARYAAELARAAKPGTATLPHFDVV